MRPEWNIFIEAYIANGGDHISAYQKAYPSASRLTASTKGKKLLRKDAIDIRIKELQKKKTAIIDQVRETQIKEAAEDSIISVTEVDAIVSRIIKQELETEKVIFTRAGTALRIKVKPSQKEVARAAELYYKRHGHFAPDKKEDVPHDPLANLTEEQLKAKLKELENLDDD